jgi:hypothetical protein
METFGTATAYHAPIELLRCPHCGQQETVERVASLFAGGITPAMTKIGQRNFVAVGTSGVLIPRITKGVTVANLAGYLLPPQEPQGLHYRAARQIVVMVGAGLIGLVLFAVGSIPAITRNTISDTVPTLPFTVVGAIILAGVLAAVIGGIVQLVSGRARRRVRDDTARYTRAMERWNRLYFCTDCQCVFAPGMAACIPHRQIHTYLHS